VAEAALAHEWLHRHSGRQVRRECSRQVGEVTVGV